VRQGMGGWGGVQAGEAALCGRVLRRALLQLAAGSRSFLVVTVDHSHGSRCCCARELCDVCGAGWAAQQWCWPCWSPGMAMSGYVGGACVVALMTWQPGRACLVVMIAAARTSCSCCYIRQSAASCWQACSAACTVDHCRQQWHGGLPAVVIGQCAQ
jgi:hypothetical protein